MPFNNVVNVEKTSNIAAYQLRHVAIVPLVVPIIDISDASTPARRAEFWENYYMKENNGLEDMYYPFGGNYTYNTNGDILDPSLIGTGIIVAFDWDSPVQKKKVSLIS